MKNNIKSRLIGLLIVGSVSLNFNLKVLISIVNPVSDAAAESAQREEAKLASSLPRPSTTQSEETRKAAKPARSHTVSFQEGSIEVSTWRISADLGRPHTWWTLVVDPSNSKRLIMCALVPMPEQSRQLVARLYGSEDAGVHWKILLTEEEGMVASEASCAFDSIGRIYFASSRAMQVPTFAIADYESLESTSIRVSKNFGTTWQEVLMSGTYADSTVLVPDPSTHNNRIYVLSDETGPLLRALKDGRIEGPRLLYHHPPVNKPAYLNLLDAAVLPDGTVGSFYFSKEKLLEDGSAQLLLFRADRNGHPISDPVVITSSRLHRIIPSQPDPLVGMWNKFIRDASFAIDGTNAVYAVWTDNKEGRARLLLARSVDSGATWSANRIIDDTPQSASVARDTSVLLPSVAVSANGIIGVQWAEFGGRCWRFSYSMDGGLTFQPSIPINPCRSALAPPLEGLGEYLMVAPIPENAQRAAGEVPLTVSDWRMFYPVTRAKSLVANGTNSFYAVWSPMGLADSAMYGSQISIDGWQLQQTAVGTSTRPVAVSDAARVWIDYLSLSFDQNIREISATVVLIKPQDTLSWPLTWRVTKLSSRLGTVSAVNSDNRLSGAGAQWTFEILDKPLMQRTSAAFTASAIASLGYSVSAPRTLRFRLDHLRAVDAQLPYMPHAEVLSIMGELIQGN